MVVPKTERGHPMSKTAITLSNTGMPMASPRFLIVLAMLGPLESGIVKISGIDFANVAKPAQTPLYFPGGARRASMMKSMGMASNIPHRLEIMMLNGEKSHTFKAVDALLEPLTLRY
jgi:hypothetical protein